MGLGHGKPSSDVSTSAGAKRLSHIAQPASFEHVKEWLHYAFGHGIFAGARADRMLPVRILTPAGEVALEQQLPGSRTVRSVLQTLSGGRNGRLMLLHGTKVVHHSTRLSELNLTEEDSLCLVRNPPGRYTPWSDDGNRPNTQHHVVKCVLMGGGAVGKTSWTRAISRESFTQSYRPTIGADFKMLRLQSEDGTKLKIQLWDTGREPRLCYNYTAAMRAFCRGAAGLMLFFSLRFRETLNEVLRKFEETEAVQAECCRRVCLVATHSDIANPEVTEEEAEQLARHRGWPFFAVSSKNQVGIDEPLFAWLDLQALAQPARLVLLISGEGSMLGDVLPADKHEPILVHEGDKAEALAIQFCKDHELQDEMVPPLTAHILENLERLGLPTAKAAVPLRRPAKAAALTPRSDGATPKQRPSTPGGTPRLLINGTPRDGNRTPRQGSAPSGTNPRFLQLFQDSVQKKFRLYRLKQQVERDQEQRLQGSSQVAPGTTRYAAWQRRGDTAALGERLYNDAAKRALKMRHLQEMQEEERRLQEQQEATFRPAIEASQRRCQGTSRSLQDPEGLKKRMKMERLRNMQEKAELDGCTFKPEIDQKSEELISQRLARLKITSTLYDSLYEDAIRRRERHLESLRAADLKGRASLRDDKRIAESLSS
ncbi:ypt2 [Symbiodinium natans]|uniref:Ypt2 protein n=1 Tax=Symbiodinium natans TaxID=878477 RepID=A0A812TTL8_9DINO|nr:ypt2 [Symbiodinium natans]